jgi:hypothetical protein
MQHKIQLTMFGALLAGAALLSGANKPDSITQHDRIEVIGHFPLASGPIVQLTAGYHWRRNYLYVDHGPAKPITILDVTEAANPKVTGELDIPKPEANGNLTAVVGTAALVASPASTPTTQTVTIMSFADPEHPKVERQFEGVTALLKDPSRGLVYLADAEGLWVLHLEPADDVELQEQYQQYIFYYR